MSLHYILDGYNIVHQMPVDLNSDIDVQRRQLVTFIETRRPHGSSHNKVTIIFDGGPGLPGGILTSRSNLSVLFSGESSADDWIKQKVEDSTNKKQIIVVTDDRDIKYAVSASGSKTISVKRFLSMGKISGGSASRSQAYKVKGSASPDKIISKVVEAKINEEMKKIWLKE